MATKKYLDRMDRQEIEELTGLMRYDPDWADLRDVLTRKGLDPAQMLLAAFCEDEYRHEYGVIVTPEAKVYEYARRTASRRSKGRLLQWHDRTGKKKTLQEWGTQIGMALKICKAGLSEVQLIKALKKYRSSQLGRDCRPEEKREALEQYLKKLPLSQRRRS